MAKVLNKLLHVLQAGRSCLFVRLKWGSDCNASETRLEFPELVWASCILTVYSLGCSKPQEEIDHLLSSFRRFSTAVAKDDSYSLLQNTALTPFCLVIDQNRSKNSRKLFKLFNLHIWSDTCTEHSEEDIVWRMHLNPFSFPIWVPFHFSSITKGP